MSHNTCQNDINEQKFTFNTQEFRHSEVNESINNMQTPSVHTLNRSISPNVSYPVSSKMNWGLKNIILPQRI
jgi:hypothetical protein